jgi:phosphatidylethanolamine-binding protein (PEBP) family uncharacterized protein
MPSGGPVPGVQEENDFREKKWGGPAPPSGTHRYFFTIYALNVPALKGMQQLPRSKTILDIFE